MPLTVDEVIEGKYKIVRLLGEGGMGAVYEGSNTRIHRRVAIKVLHAAVAAKADVVQRFEREAQAAGRIGSKHIVEVLDLGNLPGGERFMVMEYLEGESLGDRIKREGRLAPQLLAPVMFQLLEGLHAAHAAGIIHRDLKPDNVYLCMRDDVRDFVKVLDFGVSKFSALDNDMSMTKTGAVMGTPYYMSPEQARGAKIDHRSDLYSVGVVMYQAVTGRVPFNAETFNELVFKIALEAPAPVETVAPSTDIGFSAVIAKAMARDPGARFQSAKEFQGAVAQWIGGAQAAGVGIVMPPGDYQAVANAALAASGAGGVLGTSHPQLAASGANLGLSGAPAGAGVTTGGLAVTSPQPRKSGAIVAGAASVVVLAGIAFGAFKLLGSSPPPAPAHSNDPEHAATSEVAPAQPSATATATASATASAQPAASATASAEPAAEAPSAKPDADAEPSGQSAALPIGHPGRPTGHGPAAHPGKPAAAAAAAPAAAAPAPPPKAAGGRTVNTDL